MSPTINIPPQFEIVDRPLDTQMTISMGPQHPSTHGVLRVILKLDGEKVSDRVLTIGKGTTVVAQVGKRKFARVTLK